jgi:hypothetical protein
MSAVVSKSRTKSTWLTGTAGLLMVAAAVVMMVVAAPRPHALRQETVTSTSHVTRDQLTSWVWTTPKHWVSVDRAPRP